MRVPGSADVCWIDGARYEADRAFLPVSDPAVHAGLGVFETLAVREGALMERDAHLERLAAGAARLEIPLPAPDRLREWIAAAASALDEEIRGWLKIVLTGAGRCIIFCGRTDPDEEGQSARAVLLPWRRNPLDPLAGLKTLNYAPNNLGLAWARRHGADEGLWLNTRGHLAEGCTCNLFLADRARVFTPAARDGILPGIVRGLVLEAARRLGLAVHEGKVRLHRLERAREVFLTSSVRGIRPLVAFQGRPVGSGRPGPTTRRIADEVERMRTAALARLR